jgi:hypothetical protein
MLANQISTGLRGCPVLEGADFLRGESAHLDQVTDDESVGPKSGGATES